MSKALANNKCSIDCKLIDEIQNDKYDSKNNDNIKNALSGIMANDWKPYASYSIKCCQISLLRYTGSLSTAGIFLTQQIAQNILLTTLLTLSLTQNTCAMGSKLRPYSSNNCFSTVKSNFASFFLLRIQN